MKLYSEKLIDTILTEPLLKGADTIYIVTGYASANMAMRHIQIAKDNNISIKIRLIIGMAIRDGIERKNHNTLIDLHTPKYNIDFECYYIIDKPPIHSKIYIWEGQGKLLYGFAGSANYTQSAFSNSLKEVLVPIIPSEGKAYYDKALTLSLDCRDDLIEDIIEIYDSQIITKTKIGTTIDVEQNLFDKPSLEGLPKTTLTLLDSRTGETPLRSGINWGQRPGREPNQAYINISADIGRSDFFPERYEVFTVLTDDGKQLVCVRAQDNGKGLHTTLNNSHLGEYLRNRIGVANGAFVNRLDLLRYGRTDIDFYKLDEETYYLDFSV